jgi:hypothetical protein
MLPCVGIDHLHTQHSHAVTTHPSCWYVLLHACRPNELLRGGSSSGQTPAAMTTRVAVQIRGRTTGAAEQAGAVEMVTRAGS